MIMQILRIGLMGAVLYIAVENLSGISLVPGEYGFALSFAMLLAVFTFIEIVLYPFLRLILFPLRLITFGLASLALSVVLVYAVAEIVPVFVISSLLHAVLLGTVLGIVRVFR